MLDAVAFFPQLSVERRARAVWMSGVTAPIPGHPAAAAVKLAYPLDTALPVRIWAWWPDGTLVGIRHTNPDGSACVYEPGDPVGCWDRGKPLVDLLIMHAVWLVRHIFLIEFDRWPGEQIIHTALERIELQRPGELCGCGSTKLYAACHARSDLAMTDADHAGAAGMPTKTFRELILRRRTPGSTGEFEAAAMSPGFETPIVRMRRAHEARIARTRSEDVIAAALGVATRQQRRAPRRPPIEQGLATFYEDRVAAAVQHMPGT